MYVQVNLTNKLLEIKCQLDATDEFLLQILLLPQHVSDIIMPIIRSSRVLYKWLLSVVFGASSTSFFFGGGGLLVAIAPDVPQPCGLLYYP
jgi:hypothetical protein